MFEKMKTLIGNVKLLKAYVQLSATTEHLFGSHVPILDERSLDDLMERGDRIIEKISKIITNDEAISEGIKKDVQFLGRLSFLFGTWEYASEFRNGDFAKAFDIFHGLFESFEKDGGAEATAFCALSANALARVKSQYLKLGKMAEYAERYGVAEVGLKQHVRSGDDEAGNGRDSLSVALALAKLEKLDGNVERAKEILAEHAKISGSESLINRLANSPLWEGRHKDENEAAFDEFAKSALAAVSKSPNLRRGG